MTKIQGMGVALVTPFCDDLSIDYEALDNLIEYQICGGADFIVALGTTAETPTLSYDEKQKLIQSIVRKVAVRVPVVLGVGGNNTAGIIKELKCNNFAGIDAILSVVPYYNKPSQEGIYQHFKAISLASPVPIILYNVPGRTGVNMSSDITLRLAHEFENIIAIKEASGNFAQIDSIIKDKPKDFDVLSGDDGITFPLITLGATGVISVIGNAFPKEFSKMVRLAMQGDYSDARKIHHRFGELFSLLFVDGNPAGVKAMLSAMGLCNNVLRLPLVPTRITTFQKIQQILKELR